MEKKNLILIRNFLFRYFIIGLLFAILIVFMTKTFWVQWSNFVCSSVPITQTELANLFVNSVLNTRSFLIFIILVPAIALHWLIKSAKN